jgi:signal transduction histidine kinase/ActR/RegA family two-component response regulator
MSVETDRLTRKLAELLDEYTACSEESALLHAYELGRESMQHDSGLLGLVSAYRDVLDTALAGSGAADEVIRMTRAWGEILIESLGPFEMAHEGYREANSSLEMLNEALRTEIAERRRAEADLVEAKESAENANRAKSMFLSRMSHELRTPLNAILGFAQLLDMADLEAEHSDDVGRILVAGRHLLELINELLDIGRIEAGELTMSIEPVEMGEIIESAIGLVRPLAADPHVDLIAPDPHGAVAMADRQRLHQVLLNLLSNAVKYNRPGGSVTIACRATAEARIRVEITDTGRGLDEHEVSRLFVAFDRLGAEHHYDGVEGTGLGLSLSRSLVEAMHGEMGVETEVGVGSTFWFEVPAGVVATLPKPAVASGRRSSERSGSGETVLILYIEDTASNVELVEEILADRDDLRLMTAGRGRRGLEEAARHHPDLILLDLHLPDMSGEEVLRLLRQDAAIGSTPVVVITADATPGRSRSLEEMGIAAFMTKPLDVTAFLRVIDAVLGRESAS